MNLSPERATMNTTEALKILHLLADGTNPETGTVFHEDSPYQRADTVRALYCAIHLLENSDSPVETEQMPLTPAQQRCFERLRVWRMEKASETRVPAFTVMHNRVLEEIVRQPIKTESDLLKVKGIGERGIQKYGAEILALLEEEAALCSRSPLPNPIEIQAETNEKTEGENTLDAARTRFPPSRYAPLLITEVTQMQNDHFCIAAWDVHRGEMVRPLLAKHRNWIFDEFQCAFSPGQLVNAPFETSRQGVFPHCHEDRLLNAEMRVLETWSEEELFAALLPFTHESLNALFGKPLLENRYFEEGTVCPSLGGLRIARRNVRFYGVGNRLRLELDGVNGTVYSLPVTCHRVRSRFDLEKDAHAATHANLWLNRISSEMEIVLRIGLSRGYAGGSGEFSPKRCFLQINGIVFPLTEALKNQ